MLSKRVRVSALVLIFGCFSVCVFAGVVAAQNQTAAVAAGGVSTPAATTSVALLISTLFGFASVLATHFFQIYNSSRQRKWDLQDRAAARQETRKQVEEQRLETMQAAIEMARISIINRDHLLVAVKENTQLTKEGVSAAEAAYSAANDSNAKYEALRRELQEMAKQPEKKAEA